MLQQCAEQWLGTEKVETHKKPLPVYMNYPAFLLSFPFHPGQDGLAIGAQYSLVEA
jgi:hypothetical protein